MDESDLQLIINWQLLFNWQVSCQIALRGVVQREKSSLVIKTRIYNHRQPFPLIWCITHSSYFLTHWVRRTYCHLDLKESYPPSFFELANGIFGASIWYRPNYSTAYPTESALQLDSLISNQMQEKSFTIPTYWSLASSSDFLHSHSSLRNIINYSHFTPRTSNRTHICYKLFAYLTSLPPYHSLLLS